MEKYYQEWVHDKSLEETLKESCAPFLPFKPLLSHLPYQEP